jgi:predicted nucleic acid-binding protein
MTTKIYLDTSVYVKRFKEEQGSDTIHRIFRIAQKDSRLKILMSLWTINESITAIDKKFYQKKLISEDERKKVIATILATSLEYLQLFPNIEFVPVTSKILKDSTSLIQSLHISADDALHIYTAIKLRCKYFIFQDRHLKDQLTNNIQGITIVDVTNVNGVKSIFEDISKYEWYTMEEWKDKSRKGEVCAVVGCRNPPKNRCPTCFLHWCYQDVKNHVHRISVKEIKQQKKEKESLK